MFWGGGGSPLRSSGSDHLAAVPQYIPGFDMKRKNCVYKESKGEKIIKTEVSLFEHMCSHVCAFGLGFGNDISCHLPLGVSIFYIELLLGLYNWSKTEWYEVLFWYGIIWLVCFVLFKCSRNWQHGARNKIQYNQRVVSAKCQVSAAGYGSLFSQHGLSTKPCGTKCLCQLRPPVSACMCVFGCPPRGSHPADHQCLARFFLLLLYVLKSTRSTRVSFFFFFFFFFHKYGPSLIMAPLKETFFLVIIKIVKILLMTKPLKN